MNSNERPYEFVYLLRTREFIRLEENVFKIGRTSNLKQRFKKYPKFSELIRFKMVKDSVWVEKKIKELFTQKFRKMEYGLEWFEGDPNLISLAFEEIACKYEHEISDLRTAVQSNSVLSSVSAAAADVMSMILKQQENTQIQIGMIMKHHETTQQQNTDLIHQNTELVKALLADRATQPQNVIVKIPPLRTTKVLTYSFS